MKAMTGVDTPPPAGAIDQSRREALKMFGRYAAAAPAAMVLLQPRESSAGKAKGRSKGKGKGRGKRKGWRY